MLLDVFGGFTLERLALKGEERPYLPHAEDAVREKCLHGGGEPQKADAVGDRRSAARNAAGKLFLREFELAAEALVGTRFFDGVQILALEVLYERHLGELGIRCNAKHRRDFGKPRELCRAQAALTRNQFVCTAADVADDERLEDAVLRDGFPQFLKSALIEFAARLEPVRLYTVYGKKRRGSGTACGIRRHRPCGFHRTSFSFGGGCRRFLCPGCFCTRRIGRCGALGCQDVFPESECAESASESAFIFLHAASPPSQVLYTSPPRAT